MAQGSPHWQINPEQPGARGRRLVLPPIIKRGRTPELITEFEQAEAIVGTGDADVIALARAILYNPRWPWHAAAHFGARVKAPTQNLRSQPRQYRDLFDSGSEPARQPYARLAAGV